MLGLVTEDIFLLDKKDVQFFLPKVLVNLCQSPPSNATEREAALRVLFFLNLRGNRIDHEWTAKEFGEDAANYAQKSQSDLRRRAEELFGDLTSDQAAAIVEWLDLARSWDVYKEEQVEIASARRYWALLSEKKIGTRKQKKGLPRSGGRSRRERGSA